MEFDLDLLHGQFEKLPTSFVVTCLIKNNFPFSLLYLQISGGIIIKYTVSHNSRAICTYIPGYLEGDDKNYSHMIDTILKLC